MTLTRLLTCGLLLLVFSSTHAQPAVEVEDEEIEIVEDAVSGRPDPAADKFWEAMGLLWSGRSEDLPVGRAALQEASDLEYTHAQSMLASCLLSGSYGFEKNERKGANLFQLAAERGNGFAMVSIGQCYFSGTGVRRNKDTAARWLTSALGVEADYSRPEPPESVRAAQPDGIAGQMA